MPAGQLWPLRLPPNISAPHEWSCHPAPPALPFALCPFSGRLQTASVSRLWPQVTDELCYLPRKRRHPRPQPCARLRVNVDDEPLLACHEPRQLRLSFFAIRLQAQPPTFRHFEWCFEAGQFHRGPCRSVPRSCRWHQSVPWRPAPLAVFAPAPFEDGGRFRPVDWFEQQIRGWRQLQIWLDRVSGGRPRPHGSFPRIAADIRAAAAARRWWFRVPI